MLNTFLQNSQVRRPETRFTSCSVSTSNSTTASSGVPSSASSFVSPSACATVRGKPSRMNPLAASGCARRSRMMASMVSSST